MGEITQLLEQVRSGDGGARGRFFASIYAELDQLARRRLTRDLTMLDAPGLVHEVWLRLQQQEQLPGQNRRTFLAYASRVMRSVIIDYVRSRSAERNGGGRQLLTLNTGVANQVFAEPDLESSRKGTDLFFVPGRRLLPRKRPKNRSVSFGPEKKSAEAKPVEVKTSAPKKSSATTPDVKPTKAKTAKRAPKKVARR